MAENGQDAERRVTRRMVLRRERVLVLPDDVELTAERQKAIAAALGVKTSTKLLPGDAWMVVGEFSGSKTGAIEAFAGKPGTPDALPGTYKAPGVIAWKGGQVYEKPPEPKVERTALED